MTFSEIFITALIVGLAIVLARFGRVEDDEPSQLEVLRKMLGGK